MTDAYSPSASEVSVVVRASWAKNSSRSPTLDEYDIGSDIINNAVVQALFGVVYTTIFVLGLAGNALVAVVVARNRAMHTVTNVFIGNLALSDVLLCALCVPFTPLYTFLGSWVFGGALCRAVVLAQGTSVYTSTLTLTSIAVDRFFVIVHPFRPRMRLSTCILSLAGIWLFSVAATLPYSLYTVLRTEPGSGSDFSSSSDFSSGSEFSSSSDFSSGFDFSSGSGTSSGFGSGNGSSFGSGNGSSKGSSFGTGSGFGTGTNFSSDSDFSSSSGYNYCEESWPSESARLAYGAVTATAQFVLPFSVSAFCYIQVSLRLRRCAHQKPGCRSVRRDDADRERKRRTNRMLVAMVAIFGVSWMPLTVLNFANDVFTAFGTWRYFNLLFFAVHELAMSSTCYNPFLYAWMNDNFRKEFHRVLPCFKLDTVGGDNPPGAPRTSCAHSGRTKDSLLPTTSNTQFHTRLPSPAEPKEKNNTECASHSVPTEEVHLQMKDKSKFQQDGCHLLTGVLGDRL